ncbi:TIGR03905 family TSCPD domain-containing protein [Sporomusa sphaeroides]|uniref:TIGR03905 family TSCPD domain-containing protein n=1 Tax=Sporomusa sphaeroides TaxID=47679 RepID=UPI002C4577D0|nr:TIGR03905 family TSCPD domain-containing protein [Sporomusa sphaeroides]HML34919.1 TIGR03905 family TSCPD domain-containing protein [Sporomusa sphaeroides]
MTKYIPQGVCCKEIHFDVENVLVKNATSIGGYRGNLNAISKLIEGMPVEEVIANFKGNLCRNQTSCTDQLAQALEKLKK